MTTTKAIHSLAPWTAACDMDDTGHDWHEILDANGDVIATVCETAIEDRHVGRKRERIAVEGAIEVAREEIDANQRLIAAAPDLLQALIDLAAEFDRYDAAMTAIGRGHEDYGGQREAARLAIAKAQ